MKLGKAVVAGLVGGCAMTAIMVLTRALGIRGNVELLLGSLLGFAPSGATWLLGFLMHLAISGTIAILYAAGFEYVFHHAGWKAGAMLSPIHILFVGVMMGFLQGIHPLIPMQLPAPGAFMLGFGGMAVVTFVLLHVMFGAIVGKLYGPVVNKTSHHREPLLEAPPPMG